ncbi:NAD(P)-binding domain-containing protein [Rhizobium sp. KVB221]|uniref:Trimethylamine monooxygenase n=1 Tax=Rhizobium setariae TaxID=2801340 RepID=A0A936YPW3_9HYPH|nr:NAD(P)-binding domain-containing protein [Rhizobium setariae]MBL0374530.1 NAD(P)-binding domain-containing protein [Rhizobium setariae]
MQSIIPHIMPASAVAVIGAGPSGLAAARWLAQHGFEPVVFEASGRVGGQWNTGAEHSATWPGMRTNTSRVMTVFSDLDYPEGTATYPRHDQVQAYLEAYAEKFGLARCIRFNSAVELLDRAPGHGWLVRSRQNGLEKAEIFVHVVVATGRFVETSMPEIPGLESFVGSLGICHTKDYRGATVYRGKSVLMAGCSISALEIASDIAFGGAAGVLASYRKQRYVLPKLIAGVPTEHVMFTRAAAMAARMLPPDILAAGMRDKVVSVSGSPAQFGAFEPDANIFAAGITQSQHFLPAVAEGRIGVKPWIERIDGRTVHFADGSRAAPDGIVFGTGYKLSLPWLAPEIGRLLAIDGGHIDLHEHTFHPDLPGLAFLGLYDAVGPTFPVLELQARWVAYALSGIRSMPSREAMQQGIEQARAGRGGPTGIPMNMLAMLFAGNAGVEPRLGNWRQIERALLAGPLSPASFRLDGPDAVADAAERVKAAARAFGCITSEDYTSEEGLMRAIVLPNMQAA